MIYTETSQQLLMVQRLNLRWDVHIRSSGPAMVASKHELFQDCDDMNVLKKTFNVNDILSPTHWVPLWFIKELYARILEGINNPTILQCGLQISSF